MCTVYAIDSDWRWYYFGCTTCNRKVFKVGTNVKTFNVQDINSHILWCEVCKENVTFVSPRYNIIFIMFHNYLDY